MKEDTRVLRQPPLNGGMFVRAVVVQNDVDVELDRNGQFNLVLPDAKTYEITVSELSGKVIRKEQATGTATLVLQGTAKGIYLLKVSGYNGSAVRKLIVE